MTVDVKICGLSTPETVDAALDAGADLVGFVFYPKSPRNVSRREGGRTLAARARGKARIVALIVDADDTAHRRDRRHASIPICSRPMAAETPERDRRHMARLTGKPVIKAIKVKDRSRYRRSRRAMPARPRSFSTTPRRRRSLKGALPGGNGLAFDWSLLGKDGQPAKASSCRAASTRRMSPRPSR